MKLDQSFDAAFANARPVAQHCDELVRSGPRPEERASAIAAWCRDLGNELAQELGGMFTSGKLAARVAAPVIQQGTEVFARIGPVAANCLLRCGDKDATMLLSLDFATAVALTDASFGGSGEIGGEAPDQLPRSASMIVEQCAAMIAQVIAVTNGSAERSGSGVLVRSESAARLKPFAETSKIAAFEVTLSIGESAKWQLLLAVADDRLEKLMPGMTAQTSRAARPASIEDPSEGAFGAMPLPLGAVLGEFDMTLERLERLAPGDEIPLAVPRELPLNVGGLVFARGTIGSFENRMALRLSSLPQQHSRHSQPQIEEPST